MLTSVKYAIKASSIFNLEEARMKEYEMEQNMLESNIDSEVIFRKFQRKMLSL